ncbi:MAG: chromosome partition protein MukE, partial [Gilliamella apicola]|nr:chromosome partition protein MukE [Gilliamella apicola]
MSSTDTKDFETQQTAHHLDEVMGRIAASSQASIDKYMPVKLAQAIANPIFPELDSTLRSGRHIGIDELDHHAFLMDFQLELEQFY